MLKSLTADDPRTVGPYRLQNRIGTGGMGIVYLGFDRDDQPAAVKVPHPSHAGDAEFRARFRAEVAAARGVVGATVARVIDAEVDGPRPWLAAEYVAGPNLKAAVNDAGPLVGRQLDSLVIGLAEAIAVIHSAGVVHRDLNPANIVLSWTGPKVIDFGIARSADYSGFTAVGELIGTVAWMAPEQLDGFTAGPAADVFAWGTCTLFAATGRRPFPGDSRELVAHRILTADPVLDGVPDRLLPPVRAALAKSPSRRPTAGQLLGMLATGRASDPDARSNAPKAPKASQAPNDFTAKIRFSPAGEGLLVPLPADHARAKHDSTSSRAVRPRSPWVCALLFVAAGILCAAGLGLATADAPRDALFGLPAAAGAAAILVLVLTTPSGAARIATIILAALAGAGAGLVLARLGDVGQPGRNLLQLAGAVLLAAVYALIMSHRPFPPAGPTPGAVQGRRSGP